MVDEITLGISWNGIKMLNNLKVNTKFYIFLFKLFMQIPRTFGRNIHRDNICKALSGHLQRTLLFHGRFLLPSFCLPFIYECTLTYLFCFYVSICVCKFYKFGINVCRLCMWLYALKTWTNHLVTKHVHGTRYRYNAPCLLNPLFVPLPAYKPALMRILLIIFSHILCPILRHTVGFGSSL